MSISIILKDGSRSPGLTLEDVSTKYHELHYMARRVVVHVGKPDQREILAVREYSGLWHEHSHAEYERDIARSQENLALMRARGDFNR